MSALNPTKIVIDMDLLMKTDVTQEVLRELESVLIKLDNVLLDGKFVNVVSGE